MAVPEEIEQGQEVASALTGAWRTQPPPADPACTPKPGVVDRLQATGGAGLLWWRLRGSDGPLGILAETVAQTAARNLLAEQRLLDVLAGLRERGLEPVLVKGWAVGRYYPSAGIRPHGDLDLLVAPADYSRGQEVLTLLGNRAIDVDLHPGYPKLYDRTFGELFERTRLVPLRDREVRVLGEEDHLRLLAVHMLHHGAWRPLWLCDVAAALEGRSPSFDWDQVSRGHPRCTEAVACALWLAERTLGADRSGVPPALRREFPDWVAREVLRQWGRGRGPTDRPDLGRLAGTGRLRLGDELRARWRNPIQATVETRMSFNRFPRGPLQVAAFALRGPDFLRQLWAVRRGRRWDPNLG